MTLAVNEIPVAIVGYNPLVRAGICNILSSSEFHCAEYHDCSRDALRSGSLVEQQLAIFDVSSPDEDIQLLSEISENCPELRIAALVDDFDIGRMLDVFQAGADAYILKEIGSDPLIESLRLVHQGEKVLPSALLDHLPRKQALLEGQSEVQVQLGELLSEREIDTLRCLVMGYPNKVIAYRLDISEATVKVHVKAILRKLMVQNRTQAAIWAVNQGLDCNFGDLRDGPEIAAASVLNDGAMPAISLAS